MQSLVQNHPFVDGNKRTALAATGIFLELNGYVLTAGNDEALTFSRQMAGGGMELQEMAAWLEAHSRPSRGGNGKRPTADKKHATR